ncbi:hypothetical protein HZS_7833, partial [Henneguya salminicola]
MSIKADYQGYKSLFSDKICMARINGQNKCDKFGNLVCKNPNKINYPLCNVVCYIENSSRRCKCLLYGFAGKRCELKCPQYCLSNFCVLKKVNLYVFEKGKIICMPDIYIYSQYHYEYFIIRHKDINRGNRSKILFSFECSQLVLWKKIILFFILLLTGLCWVPVMIVRAKIFLNRNKNISLRADDSIDFYYEDYNYNLKYDEFATSPCSNMEVSTHPDIPTKIVIRPLMLIIRENAAILKERKL